MKHINKFSIFEGTKKPSEKMTIYIYEVNGEHRNYTAYQGYIAPNNDFMNSLIERLYKDSDGDFSQFFDNTYDYTEYLFVKTVDFFSKADIDKVPGLNIPYLPMDPSLSSVEDLTTRDPEELTFYIEDKTFLFLTLDAKSEMAKYKGLPNAMIDELMQELAKFRTWDNKKNIFSDI